MGDMNISLSVSEKIITGKWETENLYGNIRGVYIQHKDSSLKQYHEFLNIIIRQFTRFYYDPTFEKINIAKLKKEYLEKLPNIKNDADFILLIRQMLGNFKSSHINIFLDSGKVPVAYKTPLIQWRHLSPQISYIKIDNFSPTNREEYKKLLQNAFRSVRTSPNLIVDLRGNPGGDPKIALDTLGYFVKNGESLGYVFANSGAKQLKLVTTSTVKSFLFTDTKLTNSYKNGASVIKMDAEKENLYQGKLVILIDEYCYSACELFSGILQEKNFATVIGKKTKGELLISYTDEIILSSIFGTKESGIKFRIPFLDFRTLEGKRIEGVGVTPNIVISSQSGNDIYIYRKCS